MKRVIITEEQEKVLSNLLIENEGTNMKRARKYLESKGYNPEQRQKILDSLRTNILNSRLQQCKFLLGVTRLYLEGQLNNQQNIANINKTLKYIASDAHVNEYDFNLNGESLETLVNRFKSVAKNDLQTSMNASNARQLTVNDNYAIVPINSFKESSKYEKYFPNNDKQRWCVTHDENMFETYTNGGSGRFYFCLRKGFEDEPMVEGEGCPLDSYGLSMIAVSVTMEGEVNTITCRWNHDMGGNDNIMTIEQLENVIGRNFYQTFKPYTRDELHAKGFVQFDEVQELLDNGEKPENIFDDVYDFDEGFAIVELNDKYNFIDRDNKLLSNQWFDDVHYFKQGLARVVLNNKYNLININDKLLSNQWFDDVHYFREGFAIVELNDKYNFINTECKLISNKWFDWADNFYEGFARVRLNDKFNLINTEGKLISNQWFDVIGHFHDGFAIVELNDKLYRINTNGEIVENKKNKKTVIITEEQEKKLIKMLNEETQVQQIPVPKSTGKPYSIDPDKVLVVKKFLDNNFKKGNLERIGANGMPEKVRIVSMFASNGEPLKSLYEEDLQDLLIDKFKNMFKDTVCRDLFMKQVIKDWFDNKIGVFGNLSVNCLKP